MNTDVERINSIINKIQTKNKLTDNEINFIKNSGNQELNSLLILDKINNSEKLTKTEIKDLEKLYGKKPILNENNSISNTDKENKFEDNLNYFKSILKNDLSLKKSKILHLTDTHVSSNNLEKILERSLKEAEFNKNDILVHTGDLLEDFLDLQKGVSSFSSDNIIKKGDLNGVDSKEFLKSYNSFLNYIGVSQMDLKESKLNENELKEFIYSLYGLSEPNFLSNEELEDFRKHRNIVHKHLKTGIKNHARNEYSKIKSIFKKYNLTRDNLLLIAGNHDVPEVMEKILGEYMIDNNSIKNIKGIKFANPLSGSNGPVLGPNFGDVYGFNDARNNPKIKYNLSSFKSLLNYMHERGFNHINETKLEELSIISKKMSKHGIGNGYLNKYFERRIIPELDHTISKKVNNFSNLSNADIYLGHGDIANDEHASLEEKKLYNVLKNKKAIYIHGHEHGNTTRNKDGLNLINAGSGMYGNYGVYSIDKSNQIKHLLFSKSDKNTGSINYELKDMNSI